MSVSSDFKDLLNLFNACRVKYLIIGGYAVVKYTEPRYTKDLDLWIRADRKNAAAVFRALPEFGAPLAGMTEDDFAHEGYFYQMGVPPVRVDILMSITGLSFDQTWKHRVKADFDGIPVMFISREDLIASKLASGRPQDLLDVTMLSHVEQRRARQPRRSVQKK
jgi:hypothetical protein